MDASKLKLIGTAARDAGMVRATLASAWHRGEFTQHRLACGTALVDPKELKKWLKNPPRRGRPPKS